MERQIEIKVSPPPSLEDNAADLARKFTLEFTHTHNMVSGTQEAATNIAAYNFYNGNYPRNSFSRLWRKLETLSQKESEAHEYQPLPIVGIEIEAARKQYDKDGTGLTIAFLEKLALPRNRVNIATNASYWEVSTPPSYSSQTQMVLINELIRGNFIPHLEISGPPQEDIDGFRSQELPELIRKYLDQKLISLHLNIGIPQELVTHSDAKGFLATSYDLALFANLAAFAFTSPLRLVNKSSADLYMIKEATPTSKNQIEHSRYEIKTLEFGNQDIYRLIPTLQLVSAAVFAYLNGKPLGNIWSNSKHELTEYFDKRKFEIQKAPGKTALSTLATDRNFSDTVRSKLIQIAAQVKRYLVTN